MKTVRKLEKTQGRGSHSHVVFMDDDDEKQPFAIASVAARHTHEVTWDPGVEEDIYDETGTQVVTPRRPAAWVVSPGADGHTHALREVETKEVQKKGDSEEVVAEVFSLFQTALELDAKNFSNAEEAEKFYMGEQWDEADRSYLGELDRACLTINQIEGNIDKICGYQRQQRTDLHYVPTEGGDQRIADLLNVVSKVILTNCDFDREESKGFEDLTILGREAFNMFVDFETDLRGEIKVERFPWKDVVFGPHEKEDFSDMEYLIKHKMYSLAKLRQIAPDKADDISADFGGYLERHDAHVQYSHDQYAYTDNRIPMMANHGTTMVDVAKKEYRVLECWRRVYVPGKVIASPDHDFYLAAHGWSKTDLDAVRTLPGFFVVERNVRRMRITRVAGNTLLSDENPADLPTDDFYMALAYGHRRGWKWWGKVESAKDPQREVNKRRSQVIDIGNKMCAYGGFYDAATFPDTEAQKFKRVSAQPGFVVKLNAVERPPGKVEGIKFPSEIVQLMQMDEDGMKKVLNIEIEGTVGANTSGDAVLQREKAKLTGNDFLFDNHAFAKRRIGRLLVSLIKRYYSADRIFRILSHQNSKQEVQLGGVPLSEWTEDTIEALLQEQDIEKVDVSVAETGFSPSVRLGTLAMLEKMAATGAPIPPEAFLEIADLPHETKTKLMQQIQAQSEAQGQAAQSSQDSELEKTLVAKGIFPPSVVERMGIQDQLPGMTQPPVEGEEDLDQDDLGGDPMAGYS